MADISIHYFTYFFQEYLIRYYRNNFQRINHVILQNFLSSEQFCELMLLTREKNSSAYVEFTQSN